MVKKRKELYVQSIYFFCFKNMHNALQKWPHGGALCEGCH